MKMPVKLSLRFPCACSLADGCHTDVHLPWGVGSGCLRGDWAPPSQLSGTDAVSEMLLATEYSPRLEDVSRGWAKEVADFRGRDWCGVSF